MQKSTTSNYKDDSPSTPPSWFLLGMLDQQTDVLMPSCIQPFQSHSGPDMTLLPLLDYGWPVLAGDPGTKVIPQSQEEVGRGRARERHEIVLGNATAVIESLPHNT